MGAVFIDLQEVLMETGILQCILEEQSGKISY